MLSSHFATPNPETSNWLQCFPPVAGDVVATQHHSCIEISHIFTWTGFYLKTSQDHNRRDVTVLNNCLIYFILHDGLHWKTRVTQKT